MNMKSRKIQKGEDMCDMRVWARARSFGRLFMIIFFAYRRDIRVFVLCVLCMCVVRKEREKGIGEIFLQISGVKSIT